MVHACIQVGLQGLTEKTPGCQADDAAKCWAHTTKPAAESLRRWVSHASTGVMERTLQASQAPSTGELAQPLAHPLRVSASAVALPHPEKVALRL